MDISTGVVIWLTGLPCSGKTTIAKHLSQQLNVNYLDGDEVRSIFTDYGFTKEDRNKLSAWVRRLCARNVKRGVSVITAFITPYEEDRLKVKQEIPNSIIVWIKTSPKECRCRDVKGMYQKAMLGEIENFTGITAPFEIPECADLIVETDNNSIRECTDKILNYIKER